MLNELTTLKSYALARDDEEEEIGDTKKLQSGEAAAALTAAPIMRLDAEMFPEQLQTALQSWAKVAGSGSTLDSADPTTARTPRLEFGICDEIS